MPRCHQIWEIRQKTKIGQVAKEEAEESEESIVVHETFFLLIIVIDSHTETVIYNYCNQF
jgi:hypothetical protein